MLYVIKNGEIVGKIPQGVEVSGEGISTTSEVTESMLEAYESIISSKIEEKRKECRDVILAKYSNTDQVNNLMFGSEKEINDMKKYISDVLEEFRKKGADADFSRFI